MWLQNHDLGRSQLVHKQQKLLFELLFEFHHQQYSNIISNYNSSGIFVLYESIVSCYSRFRINISVNKYNMRVGRSKCINFGNCWQGCSVRNSFGTSSKIKLLEVDDEAEDDETLEASLLLVQDCPQEVNVVFGTSSSHQC